MNVKSPTVSSLDAKGHHDSRTRLHFNRKKEMPSWSL